MLGKRHHELRGGLDVGYQPSRTLNLLPLTPLWPAFALNTLLYATLTWLLSCALLALRRFRRIRRGLCPTCAYPTGESSVCSECGATRVAT